MQKTALVTGAASGIGYYLTEQLSHSGYHVIAIDSNHNVFNDNVTPFVLNLKEESQLSSIIENINHIDLAINCAGVSCERKDLTEFSTTEIIEQWQDNFLITFNALKYEILKMRMVKQGKIINISSITAHRGMKNFSAYSIGKASIAAITKVAAIENAQYNIQINSISPATIDTPMIRKKYGGNKRDYSDVYYTGDCGTTHDIYAAIQMFIDSQFFTGYDLRMDGGISDLCKM